MTLLEKFLALFGAQYVMLRVSNHLTFIVKRAYLIGGRYFVQSKHMPDMSRDADTTPMGEQAWYMLTAASKLTRAVDELPQTTLASFNTWIPLTNLVDAHVGLLDEGHRGEPLSSAATGEAQAASPNSVAVKVSGLQQGDRVYTDPSPRPVAGQLRNHIGD